MRIWQGLVVLMLLSLAAVCHAASGENWEYHYKMVMAGMGAMPAMTLQKCQEPGWKNPPQAQQQDDSNCKVEDMQRSGNSMSWKMRCTGREAMTGTGNVSYTSDTFKGAMDFQTTHGDMHMDMDGRKLGSCDINANDDAVTINGQKMPSAAQMQQYSQQMQASVDASNAGMCTQAVMNMTVDMFTIAGSPCAKQQADFCKRAKTGEGALQIVQQSTGRDTLGMSSELCKIGSDKISANACDYAKKQKNWDVLHEHCVADFQSIAQQQCAGRSYSAVMQGEYGSFCSQYASDMLEAPKQAKPSTVDKAKDAAKKLKDLIHW